MTEIAIPKEALEAAARAIASDDGWPLGWEDYIDTARAACLAMLKAWPGMQIRLNYFQPTEEIILPLPQEKTDV